MEREEKARTEAGEGWRRCTQDILVDSGKRTERDGDPVCFVFGKGRMRLMARQG